MSVRIGVLALQGAFREHIQRLREVGAETVEVRLPAHLAGLDGLIIPGGESTTIGKLMVDFGLIGPIRELARSGFPVWGTCAGAILLARHAVGGEPPLIGAMDVDVARNAFGRQVDSFEVDLNVSAVGAPPFHAIFIRAPRIESTGEGVEVLAALPSGEVVAARQGSLLATSFHPELTQDSRFHRLFVDTVSAWKAARNGAPP